MRKTQTGDVRPDERHDPIIDTATSEGRDGLSVSRRAFVTGAPLALLPGAAAGGEADDARLLALCREYFAAVRECDRLVRLPGNGDMDTPECVAALERQHAALEAVSGVTPRTMAGIAALAEVLWHFNGPCFLVGTEGFAEEIAAPENRLLAAIWRGASGRDGIPPVDHLR